MIYYRPDSNHTLNVTTSTAFLGMRRWGIRIVRVMGVGDVGMGGSVFDEEEQPMRLADSGYRDGDLGTCWRRGLSWRLRSRKERRCCIVLFVAVAESGNGGRHRYLPDIQYLTSKSLHATAPHTYNSLSSTHYAYTTILSDSAINVSNRS